MSILDHFQCMNQEVHALDSRGYTLKSDKNGRNLYGAEYVCL